MCSNVPSYVFHRSWSALTLGSLSTVLCVLQPACLFHLELVALSVWPALTIVSLSPQYFVCSNVPSWVWMYLGEELQKELRRDALGKQKSS